ncbi:hypothetical protein [Companilactobacillus formosensis]|uniref:hypothetical protein n=1 Tax=Companilactobacillus formosensis TaxID=1617889 RepID=UPI0010F94FF6|nr:hypothetical protein [Companilactobacillus formosensis]
MVLFLIVSILSIYLTGLDGHIWSFLEMGNDGRFHVMRMQGLYEAIKHGNFFPIVNMSFLGGFGYISNIFYSNLWLYPVAFLRLLGMTTVQAFISFYVLLNFVTFVISFESYYVVSRRFDKSLIFSFVYTLSTYRIFDMVRRFDIGEVLTLTFLPIVILGVYEIFYADNSKWWYLTIGMTAVIYSHALSPILIAIFILLVVIFRIKTLIKEPKRILTLIYSGLSSLLLSLGYFLPMYEQLKHTQFKLTHSPLIYVSQGSMQIPNLVKLSLENDLFKQNIGILMLLMALIIPVIIWKTVPAIRDFAIIGEILLLMTTDIFPWNLFIHTPLNIIQFPWRFNMLVTILFAVVLASDPCNWLNRFWKKGALISVTIAMIFVAEFSLVTNHPTQDDSYAAFNNLDVYSIGAGQEYLPKNANLGQLRRTKHVPEVKSGSIKIKDFQQKGSSLKLDFNATKSGKIDLPIIGYYGYTSKSSTGNVSSVKMDQTNNGLAQVKVRGSGILRVNYQKTLVQKISKLISLISFLIMIIYLFRQNRVSSKLE